MADELLEKVHDLSDLELAALICLVAQEHCIVDTEPTILDDLVGELELIAAKVFGLSHAVVDCSEHTSVEDFAHAVISADDNTTRSNSPVRTRRDSYFLHGPAFPSASHSPGLDSITDHKTIANVIIAKNLDEASKQVQIQALELMRTKRIYTRTSVHNAPKRFLFIALLAGGEGPRLNKHLNDYMFISHFHAPEDGFPNLEELLNDGDSISSVVRKSPKPAEMLLLPRISATDIEQLALLSDRVIVSVEVRQYLQNVICFLRCHRAVAGGVSAVATQKAEMLIKCLAPLHGLSYVTPSLVGLAARKVYSHRIRIAKPEHERSMQWGSDVNAIAALLEGIGPEDVIEDVLGNAGAEVPL